MNRCSIKVHAIALGTVGMIDAVLPMYPVQGDSRRESGKWARNQKDHDELPSLGLV